MRGVQGEGEAAQPSALPAGWLGPWLAQAVPCLHGASCLPAEWCGNSPSAHTAHRGVFAVHHDIAVLHYLTAVLLFTLLCCPAPILVCCPAPCSDEMGDFIVGNETVDRRRERRDAKMALEQGLSAEAVQASNMALGGLAA